MEVHTFLLRTPSPKRSLLMRRMLIVVLLTALSIPLAAHTKIETICGHVGVQSGKDISMTTDEVKKLIVLSDDSASEERLLKARPDQRVCATGTLTPTSITAGIVTYWGLKPPQEKRAHPDDPLSAPSGARWSLGAPLCSPPSAVAA